jgi:hypothetical protein
MVMIFSRYCCATLILTAIGCGSGTPLPETVPVTGVVSYQGNPVEGAQVVLNNTDPKGRPASGMTDVQGRFSLETYVDAANKAKGAMPGMYKGTITKVEQSTMSSEEMMKAAGQNKPVGAKQLLPEKYGNLSKTDLNIEIKKGNNEPLKLDLTD